MQKTFLFKWLLLKYARLVICHLQNAGSEFFIEPAMSMTCISQRYTPHLSFWNEDQVPYECRVCEGIAAQPWRLMTRLYLHSR